MDTQSSMTRHHGDSYAAHRQSVGVSIARATWRLAWFGVRLPLFSLLVILEPVVRTLLAAAALLGVALALLFRFSGAAPQFPFWTVVGIALGCGLLLPMYHAAIRLVSR